MTDSLSGHFGIKVGDTEGTVSLDDVLIALKAVIDGGPDKGGFTRGTYEFMADTAQVASGEQEPHGGVSLEDRQRSLKSNIYALLSQTENHADDERLKPARALLRQVADGLDVDIHDSTRALYDDRLPGTLVRPSEEGLDSLDTVS